MFGYFSVCQMCTNSTELSRTQPHRKQERNFNKLLPPDMAKHLNPAAARQRRSLYIRGAFTVKNEIESEAPQTGTPKKFGGSFYATRGKCRLPEKRLTFPTQRLSGYSDFVAWEASIAQSRVVAQMAVLGMTLIS